MIDKLLANLAPHHCYGCGDVGALVCTVCKNNITETPFLQCVGCLQPLATSHLCKTCDWPFEDAWCVGERSDVLRQLIDGVKFERKQAGVDDMIELLEATMPILPDKTVIVPVPASARSVRERGYDHMLLVARGVAARRQLRVQDVLIRQSQDRMHELPRKGDRAAFAKKLFRVRAETVPADPILLLDDIITTGATVKAAAELLRSQGARQVMLGAIARHIKEV